MADVTIEERTAPDDVDPGDHDRYHRAAQLHIQRHADQLDADRNDALLCVVELALLAVDRGAGITDCGTQRVQLVAHVIGFNELGFQVRRTNAVIPPAVDAVGKAATWLTELGQALLSATLIRLEIYADTVLGAGLSMVSETIAGIAAGAVFITDCRPVAQHALVSTHRGAATKPNEREGQDNVYPLAVHVEPLESISS